MDISIAFAWGPIFFAFAVLAFFFLRRACYRYNVRRGKKNPGFYPTFAILGNVFQRLQKLGEPGLKFVLEEKSDDHADNDEDADPTDPMQHLHRQLKRIRNGERLDQITTLLH